MVGIDYGQFFAGFGIERMLFEVFDVFGGDQAGIGLGRFEVL